MAFAWGRSGSSYDAYRSATKSIFSCSLFVTAFLIFVVIKISPTGSGSLTVSLSVRSGRKLEETKLSFGEGGCASLIFAIVFALLSSVVSPWFGEHFCS